jgi:ComF family protein
MLKTLLHATSRLPGLCQVCGRWPAQPVCEVCAQRFAAPRPRCSACAAPLPQDQVLCGSRLTHAVLDDPTRCLAAVDYAYPWDRLIARFKFHDEPGWADPLAERMLRAPDAAALMVTADWLVPMPLSPQRLAQRGYNQAWELVKALRALQAQAPPGLPDALVRLGEAPDQHTLPREQRLRNLRHAFAAHPDRVGLLQGRRVLLADDVSTTRTTLRSAARALRMASAADVSALVIARTPPH